MSVKQSISIVDVTCFGNDANINEYANNAIEWIKRELVPRSPVFCPCLNDFIHLSNNKVIHTIRHKEHNQQGNFNHDTIAVLSELESIINNSEVRYITQDQKRRQYVTAIVKLRGKVILNDKIREIELLIQQIYDPQLGENKYHFYNHVLL